MRKYMPVQTHKKIARDWSPVSVSENGRKFIVELSGDRKPMVVHVDEDPNATQCDYAFKVFEDDPKEILFLVELKGGKVKRGLEQLLCTVKDACRHEELRDCKSFAKRYACVVASHCHGMSPSVDTGVQVLKAKIQKEGFEEPKIRTNQLTACVSADFSVAFK